MRNLSKLKSGAVKAAILLSSLSIIQMAYAAETEERKWGEVDTYSSGVVIRSSGSFQEEPEAPCKHQI